MKNLLLLSLILFISGCVAHEGQQPPPPANTEAPVSVIEEERIRKPKRISNFKYSDELINEIKLLSRPRQAAKSLRLNKKTVKLDKHVSGFYLNREFKPAWLTNSGFGNKISNELIEIINESDLEGLNPEDYYINEIYTLLDKIEDEEYSSNKDLARMDILLTNSLFKYANHTLHGSPKIKTYKFDKKYVEPFVNMTKTLSGAVKDKKIGSTLNKLKPDTPQYERFIEVLEKYSELNENGGWPRINPGKDLRKGMADRRVSVLRKRLEISGDLRRTRYKRSGLMSGGEVNLEKLENDPNYQPPMATFDKDIDAAVRSFQRRHNLIPDGIVGGSTLRALNVTSQKKVDIIKANLNVLRKLPRDLGDRYIFVNIPSYKLYGYEGDNAVLEMKVIVGKESWKTPIFSEEISYLVVNPFWNIPNTILKDEFLPNLKEDPNFLKGSDIKVVGANETFDPDKYDWENFDSEEWVYKLRQDPGPSNPLGRIKFMFPNKHNVYLHDTPHKKFFDRTKRSFSHGCVRVEDPMQLVDFVLKKEKDLNAKDIEEIIESKKVKRLNLENHVPVHLMYFTVWVDENDVIYFPQDIYNKVG